MTKVGIFWSKDDNLIFVRTQDIENAISTQISIDSTFSHSDEWEKISIILKSNVSKSGEYFELPRGRILYLKEKKSYVIYHGNIFNDNLLKKIIIEFQLENEKINS